MSPRAVTKTKEFSRVIVLTPARLEQVRNMRKAKLEKFLSEELVAARAAIHQELNAWKAMQRRQPTIVRVKKTSIKRRDNKVTYTVTYEYREN